MEAGSDLKIAESKFSPNLAGGAFPLSRVELGNSAIEILPLGWERLTKLKGFPSLIHFFSGNLGMKALSLAISHETIHQVLFEIEGKKVSLMLDKVSGAAEFV